MAVLYTFLRSIPAGVDLAIMKILNKIFKTSSHGEKELPEIALGTGFGRITVIKTSPDGTLYVPLFDKEVH